MPNSELKKIIMSDIAFIDDGVVHMKEPPDVMMGLPEAKEMIAAISELGNGDKVILLGDLRRHRGFTFDREGHAYLGGKELGDLVAAVALLVNSPISTVVGNFFMTIYEPDFPLKLFASESEAIEWLKDFV